MARDEHNLKHARDKQDLINRLRLQAAFNSNPFTQKRLATWAVNIPLIVLYNQPRLLILLNSTIIISRDPGYTVKSSTLKVHEVRLSKVYQDK